MQTMAPPDEILKERFARLDERIGAVDRRVAEAAKETDRRLQEVNRRITEVGKETNRRITEVDRRITETSAETNRRLEEIGELKQEMKALQLTFQRGNFALVISVIGVLLATIFKGG
jgi:chromosome segregation ATPase